MSAAWRGYHYDVLLHDHGGADIHNHLCPGDDHRRHHYFFVDLDLYDHRAANDDLHRAGYDYVYDHHVALNDVHLDYHFPAPDDYDHGGADIDIDQHDDDLGEHYLHVVTRDLVLNDDDQRTVYDLLAAPAPTADDQHVHYDPDDYEYVDQHDDDLASH